MNYFTKSTVLATFMIFFVAFSFGASLSIGLSLSDSSIAEGESTTLTVSLSGSDSSVTATLTNSEIGDQLTVSPWQGTNGQAIQTVGSVDGSTTTSFVITGNSVGTYELQVTAQGAGASAGPNNVTLTVSTPAFVTVSNDSCNPTSGSTVDAGDSIEMTYTVSNTGGSATNVVSSITSTAADIDSGPNGTTESYTESLNGGAQSTYTWSYTAGSSGTATLSANVTSGTNNPTDPSDCTYTITAAADSSGGGGGSSTSDIQTKTISIDETDKTKGTANFSNSDNEGVDSVAINFAEEISGPDLTLKLNNTPDLTDDAFKVISEYTVLQYLQFTFSGESSKVKSADIKFSLLKTDVTKKEDIRLARLENGVWKYYTPSNVQDLGTYYQFTVNVSGFSYFAIIELKAPPVTETTEVSKETTTTETGKKTSAGTESSSTTESQETPEPTPESASEGLAWWVWTIIAVVVVVVIVFIVMGLRK